MLEEKMEDDNEVSPRKASNADKCEE